MDHFDEDGKNLNCNEGTEKLLDNNTVPSLNFLSKKLQFFKIYPALVQIACMVSCLIWHIYVSYKKGGFENAKWSTCHFKVSKYP